MRGLSGDSSELSRLVSKIDGWRFSRNRAEKYVGDGGCKSVEWLMAGRSTLDHIRSTKRRLFHEL